MAAASLATLAQIRLPGWFADAPPPQAPASDLACMDYAIRLARESVARGGGPFGAVIREAATGAVIAAGVNMSLSAANPVLHAEMVALCLAAPRLPVAGAVSLYSSCEPCIMCLGAAHWAQVARIVSAARRRDALALGFSEGAGVPELRAEMTARGVVFKDGLRAQAGRAVLAAYAARGGVIYGPRP